MRKVKIEAQPAPEDLYQEALAQIDFSASDKELRLLQVGVNALAEARKKTVNKVEQLSLQSMISYVAYTQKFAEETISAMLLARFDLTDVKEMQARTYLEAIHFLVDLDPRKVFN